MAIGVEQSDALSVREEVIDFLWEKRHWPFATREEYERVWDWRYSSLSDGDALVSVARDKASGLIVGHIAVYPRTFELKGEELRVGIPGNLLVQPEYRGTIAGPRLISYPRSLVKDGILDAVIAFGNAVAHPLFLRLGFREIGTMDTWLEMRRSAAALRRRNRFAAAAAPLIDAGLKVHRAVRRRSQEGWKDSGSLLVRRLDGVEFASSSRGHWVRPADRLVAADSPGFVVRRYLEAPHVTRQLFGLLDPESGLLEGYVVTEGEQRLKVWDCQVNRARITEAAAISRVAATLGTVESAFVSTLPDTKIGKELSSAGYLHSDARGGVEERTMISAFWSPDHPLADELEQVNRWQIWPGSNHY